MVDPIPRMVERPLSVQWIVRGLATRGMLESLGEYATGSGMNFPAEVLIVTATR